MWITVYFFHYKVKVAEAFSKDWPINFVTNDQKSLLGNLFPEANDEEDESSLYK